MVNTKNKPKQPVYTGLGLDGLGDLSALLNAPESENNNGRPIELDMSLVDEDPNQPRTENNPGFSNDNLNELAASIRLRGVKTPISVRANPDVLGRFIINHGARRFRASKRAEKSTIPAFIDNDYIDDDQVIENLHRDDLTAREIADHIGRKLAMGMKKSEIARVICKSPAFITQHVTLLDLPDPIAVVFNNGRVKDVTTVNELVTAYKKNRQEVETWLADENQELTRSSIKLLREYLEEKLKYEKEDEYNENYDTSGVYDNDVVEESHDNNQKINENINTVDNNSNINEEKTINTKAAEDQNKLKKAILIVEHDGRNARLLLNKRPSNRGYGWFKYEDNGEEFETNLKTVILVNIMEG